MKWRMLVPICVSLSCGGAGGFAGDGTPPPMRESEPSPPCVHLSRANVCNEGAWPGIRKVCEKST